MISWLFLTATCLFILPMPCSAEEERHPAHGILTGYSELGRKSTSEDYEEEDEDNDYIYKNYHLKFERELSRRFGYDVSSFIYDKDYTSKDSLDNISRIFKTRLSYYTKEGGDSTTFGFKLNYREKRYNNTPKSEYDEIRLEPSVVFKKKDLYRVNISGGIDNFDYLTDKDQFKIFGDIEGKRYLLEERLTFSSSYGISALEAERVNRKDTKHNVSGAFDYIFNLPCLYKISAGIGRGSRDTKVEEERDEDYDYDYRQYYAATQHRVNPELDLNLKYNYFRKDYLAADLDHSGFYVEAGWRYEIIDDEDKRLWLEFSARHKEVDYPQKLGNNYNKETIFFKTSYQKKKNWKVSVSLDGNFYDYSDARNDRDRYYAVASVEKVFLKGDLTLSMDFKYRYTDYEKSADSDQAGVRTLFKYRF